MKKIRICEVCKKYTLDQIHCSKSTISAHPARFNPHDKYAKYRFSSLSAQL